MEAVGAYGGGKAGGTFDPIGFIQRPQVILRAVCWVSTLKSKSLRANNLGGPVSVC